MAARIELTIEGNGAAFDTVNGSPADELARMLRALAKDIEDRCEGRFTFNDINGNYCGKADVSIWDEEADA